MKFLSWSIFLCLTVLFSCTTEKEEKVTTENSKSKWETKHEPSDWFSLQRAYPDKHFDVKAYTDALHQTKNTITSRTIEGFEGNWIVQGPGNLGGRVNTIAVHPNDPNTIYIGFARGGVYKTEDGGQNWLPIFDDQLFLAIGDIAIDPTNPEIVYVGTGDPNISGLPAIGNGVYKSENGGQTWLHLGLEEQRIVSEIAIDPNNPSTIYTACMGVPFERNTDRGLYKSIDSGASWEKILFVSDSVGIVDIALNPGNPQILYAATWTRIRNNHESIITGAQANIYKSEDGGISWNTLSNGLPQDNLGRIGLTMVENNPDVLYAMYVGTDSQLFGIYKTIDGGNNWVSIPIDEESTGLSDSALGGFGWYFGQIRVNPDNEDEIYLLGVDLWFTQNGGQEWELATPEWWYYSVHADKHDLVFSQTGGQTTILLGTDGGLYQGFHNNLPNAWTDIENIPTNQFYRVAYNPHQPNQYFGGMQDNGSTGGNESFINQWPRIYGGDGFQMVFHPSDPNISYAETQNGGIVTYDATYNYYYDATNGIDWDDRRNWDMQYILSSHDPTALYTGTYRVYSGFHYEDYLEWSPISESLTNEVEDNERFHTISTLSESAVNENILYVGTTDANVWRTLDQGNNWEQIDQELPERYVTDIKASPSIENTVYVTHSGYKDNDFIPHVHRSDDNGDHWTNISSNLPPLAINDIYIIPQYQDSILFVATDAGIYGSVNAGEEWERLGIDMPYVPTYDLEYNPATNELIAGTYGKSIMTYSLDSIMPESTPPVAVLNPDIPKKGLLKIFPNPATDNITLDFSINEPGRDADVAIINSQGQLVKKFKIPYNLKINWPTNISNLPEGNYFVKVKIRHQVLSGSFIKA